VSESEADLMTTAFWGVFTLGRFAVAAASRSVRPAPLLAAHLAVVTLSLLVVVLGRAATPLPGVRLVTWIILAINYHQLAGGHKSGVTSYLLRVPVSSSSSLPPTRLPLSVKWCFDCKIRSVVVKSANPSAGGSRASLAVVRCCGFRRGDELAVRGGRRAASRDGARGHERPRRW
jgi:hypothetical protein